MLDIIEKEIKFDETLKMRIELICKLAHVKPIFHNGSMKRLETVKDDNKALNIKVKALEKQNKQSS